MKDNLDDYNLGVVEDIKKDSIIIKPVIVIDDTGYENFEIKVEEKFISLYQSELEEAGGTILLAYDKNKNLIDNQ